MGNKNTSPPKGPDTGTTKTVEGDPINGVTESISGDGPLGPSPELLTSLQSLGENSDYTLLPQSLHQIAEVYQLKEDYQWAIQFLQLEKIYHERLLSNLAALQENWESQWKEKKNTETSLSSGTDGISQEHIEILNHICKTHHRPSLNAEKSIPNVTLKDIQSIAGQWDRKTLQFHHDKVSKSERTHQDDDEEEEQNMNAGSELPSPHAGHQAGGEEEEGEDEERYEEGQEVEEEEELCEETPEEEEVKVEWPSGVPQASDKDLAKLSHTEGSSCTDGLVSILKRRRASLDGLPPIGPITTKHNSKRKVRFSEPEDGIEQDEVGGDSCLILLLLCVVTVVISIGGTALYCTLVDTYSNICTDFSQNVNFYVTNVRSFFDELRHWLPLQT